MAIAIIYGLSAISCALLFFFAWKQWLRHLSNVELLRLKEQRYHYVLKFRMKAYERIVLWVERMDLSRMLHQLPIGQMTVSQVQQELLQKIRVEFEHNMTQQLYISRGLWVLAQSYRDELRQLIISAIEDFKPEDSALAFSHALLADAQKVQTGDKILQLLRKEYGQMVGV